MNRPYGITGRCALNPNLQDSADNAVFVSAGDADTPHLVVQALALSVNFYIIGGVAGEKAAVFFLEQHFLHRADARRRSRRIRRFFPRRR